MLALGEPGDAPVQALELTLVLCILRLKLLADAVELLPSVLLQLVEPLVEVGGLLKRGGESASGARGLRGDEHLLRHRQRVVHLSLAVVQRAHHTLGAPLLPRVGRVGGAPAEVAQRAPVAAHLAASTEVESERTKRSADASLRTV